MSVFAEALRAIVHHKTAPMFRPGEAVAWVCRGCDWVGGAEEEADVHVAEMVDAEVD